MFYEIFFRYICILFHLTPYLNNINKNKVLISPPLSKQKLQDFINYQNNP